MDPPRLYTDLASWWPVLSDPAEYAEEAHVFRQALEATATRPLRTLLELGSGGGSNASHLKAHYDLTLVDRAPGMLAVSRTLNPECEHVEGDMRTVRVGRTFDAVFVHDAVFYLRNEEDLGACMATARAHLEPGGVALFVPDQVRETWAARTSHGGHDRGDRSMRYLQWEFDPDPGDTEVRTLMAYVLREHGAPPRVVLDEHVGGLFPRATWLRLLDAAGFSATTRPYPHSSSPHDAGQQLFLGTAR